MLQEIISSALRNKSYKYVMDGTNFFDQPVKKDFRKYVNITKNLH